MGRKKLGLVLSVLVLVLLLAYYWLGGFRAIEVSSLPCQEIELAGILYEGTPQDERLGESFKKIERLIGQNPGKSLHTVYYVEPAGKLDTMKVFVGLEKKGIDDGSVGLEHLSFSCKESIVARLSAHRFVMPGPLTVKKKIQEYANENGLEIEGIFIDKIIDASHVEVVAPVKPVPR